ncbi:MAG: hypothetical protein NUK62_01355 [Tenericutes bacterium]|nr:hypothetical protein [Mycoplasmatota bacterium]
MAVKKKKVRVDKYSKVQPKVPPLTLGIIIGSLVLIFALIIIFRPDNQTTIYRSYNIFVTDERFTEDHPFYQVDYKSSLFSKGLDKIITQDEVVIVYVGYTGCESCLVHIAPFQAYYESEGMDEYVDQIYYLDPSKDSKGFEAFRLAFEEVGDATPQLIVFLNGEIIETFDPQSTEDMQLVNRSVRDFYRAAKVKLDQ